MKIEEKKDDKLLTLSADKYGIFSAELKTLEIDKENKIFKINGIDFGRRCTSVDIHIEAHQCKVYLNKEVEFWLNEQ